jgi:hypothetical protein
MDIIKVAWISVVWIVSMKLLEIYPEEKVYIWMLDIVVILQTFQNFY